MNTQKWVYRWATGLALALTVGCSDGPNSGSTEASGAGAAGPGSGGSTATGTGGSTATGTGGSMVTGSSTATSSATTGTGTSCMDACSPNAERCAGSQVQQCTTQADGCYGWSAPASCPVNETCLGTQCVLACADQCLDGAKQCNGGKAQTCAKQANGCTDWGASQDCPAGQTCSGGTCVASCTDQCSVGAVQCSGPKTQTCAKQANGCTDWSAAQDCPAGNVCSGGQCVLACTNQCTAGAVQCSGSQVQTCSQQVSGCTGWNPATDCPANQTCSGGQCVLACTDECTAGATQCAGSQIQSCAMQANGCTGWNPAQSCASGQTCAGGACVIPPCTTGALRCTGAVLETCNGSQQWVTQQACTQSCDPQTTACVAAGTTCTASTWRCSGNVTEECNAAGTAWLGVQSCAVGCSGGLCTGACTPGAARCNGNTPETCNAGGNAWTQGAVCTTFCAKGACAHPSLTIDANANATLDGEHFYQGDVVIKNSSTLSVPSGKLIIHAKSFILDASSQIVVAPTGNDPRGAGTSGGYSSCNSGAVLVTGNVGGTGGGYGAQAMSTSVSLDKYVSFMHYVCKVTTPGGSSYAIADDEAAPGAAGGDCSGGSNGKGGGLLAIHADNILTQGLITANGQNGTGCAGGGSGGGVFLRAANDLGLTGSVSVAGGSGGPNLGAGAGGQGVVKLLYGNTHTLTGAVTGVKFQSFMPPTDLASATHPDPTRWYNDAFSAFDLAWNKPFSSYQGYYTKFNGTYGFVPTLTNGLFQSGEAALFPASALSSGTNYFHAATLGPPPLATLGTVESRFAVHVNATPPSIASVTHPSGSTWYGSNPPQFTWTVPHANADTTSFYWAFDPYLNTVPTKADNKIPMDLSAPQNSKTLLLVNKPAGIWFLHLIAEDTMGYLTKSAAHYRVQLGNDPGKGSVSGSVTDATTSAFVSGVTITLNRGVQSTTSNAGGGYAFPSSVYAQQYEVTASKAGYKDAVKMVTVTPNQTSTVNFSLSP